jgi:hypothetical protein
VAALNNAWGSNYTAFGSAGGYGTGTGLLDENGRNTWIGVNGQGLPNESGWPPAVEADLNAFLSQLAVKYCSVTAAAIRAVLPHHLVLSFVLHATARPQVLSAVAQYFDVVNVGGHPATADLQTVYSATNKPLYIYLLYTAQADSALAAYPCAECAADYATQGTRGAAYAAELAAVSEFIASNGIRPVIGIEYWEWVDKQINGEHGNFGLVSDLDNPYDGTCDQIAAAKDAFGFACGGEPANFGNFLGTVIAANNAAQ